MTIALLHRILVCLVCTIIAVPLASAQSYPNRPVRIIVPYAPGGLSDVLVRAVADGLAQSLKQQFLIDNRPGANLIIGTELAAKAAPDGYTLLLGTDGPISANPFLYAKLSYDPPKDFAPVANLVFANEILMVPGDFPAKDVREFIEYAKTRPGKLNYGSFGGGSLPHLVMELFKRRAGIDVVHVPFKSSALATTAMVSGEIQAMFISIPGPLGNLRSGKLKALAIGAPERSAALKDVPTFDEAGVPGIRAQAWFGILAPAGTPREILTLLNTEINRILENPDFREKRITSLGLDPAVMTVDQFGAFLKQNRDDIEQMVRISGARLD